MSDHRADAATETATETATDAAADSGTTSAADAGTTSAADAGTDQSSVEPRPRPRPGAAAPATRSSRRAQEARDAPPRWWLRGPVLLVVAVALTAIAIIASVVALRRHDAPPQAAARTGTADSAGAAARAFVAGAAAGVGAVTTYDYRSLDLALRAADGVTTGAYRRAYRAAIEGSLGRQARAQRIVQTFRQTAAGIGEMSSDLRTAKVLIFGVQTVVRGDSDPQDSALTLTATMQRVGSRYLISRLDAGANAGVPAGSARVADAAETARRHVVAALTLRRDSLDFDEAAALAATGDPLRSELQASLPAEARRVRQGGYDLTGRATAVAIEQARGDRVIVLVAATGSRTENGRTSVVADQRLRVNVLLVGGAWQVTDIADAGV